MRGAKEQRCLDIVRNKYDVQNCYALSIAEYNKIESYLKLAIPNPRNSEFPDFLFSAGYIEHFQISSSNENRRGSEHIEKDSNFNRESDRIEAIFKEDIVNNQNEVEGITTILEYPEHSYDNLVRSFKAHWSDHITSLEKMPQYKGGCGIFMIEYCDMAIDMLEDIFQDSQPDLSLHIREQQRFDDYKLSRDKDLLQYIEQYKDIIHYVIYINTREIEIISTSNVAEIIKLLPWDFRITSRRCQIKRRSIYNIPIPINIQEEPDNDQP